MSPRRIAEGESGSPPVLTIRDVARVAGVSTATVSRALRGLDNVDPATRDRIVAIASDLQFSVSPAASRLATGRTGTIGIVTPFVGRWYFAEIFAGVEESLKRYDLDLLLHTTEPRDESGLPSAHIRMRRRVDGVLVVGLAADSDEVRAMAALGSPVVLLGARSETLPSVRIDDRLGARLATAHLAECGHTRIGLITGRRLPTRFLPENDRLAGYLDVLTERGLSTDETLRAVGLFTTPGGEEAMTRLLASPNPPTAVFCMSDEMAYGALRALRRAGRRAGSDTAAGEIALIGFDDHDLADIFGLSTIRQPVRDLGRAAAEMLMARIGVMTGAVATGNLVMPVELCVRATTVEGASSTLG
jgi:LacI family repressor for deo operon, udp, cdd, tsx, nupC, and nupG